jgi:hypothetical protein
MKNYCYGIVYRANVHSFITKRGVGRTVRLNKLKRFSCGCEKCRWFEDSIGEISEDWPILGLESVEHGKTYTITSCNESRDFETGYIDDWDFQVVELPIETLIANIIFGGDNHDN